MPLVRVELSQELFDSSHESISDAIHQAQVEKLGVPEDDFFQVFTPHQSSEIKYSKTYLGVDRTDLMVIQMTAVHMHGEAAKTEFFRTMVGKLAEAGVPTSNVLISWSENCFGDWYAGKL